MALPWWRTNFFNHEWSSGHHTLIYAFSWRQGNGRANVRSTLSRWVGQRAAGNEYSDFVRI